MLAHLENDSMKFITLIKRNKKLIYNTLSIADE